MANVIGEFVAKIGADTKGFTKGVDKSESRMGRLGASMKKHSKAIALGVVGMAAAASAAIIGMVNSFANAGDEIQKMALRTGFTTEALSELKHAADLSGTSINSVEKAVKRMQMGILDANRGLKESMDNFQDLGITLDDLAGKSPEEQFTILTEALAGVDDATTRAALAAKIFGRAGTELLPMLSSGKEGLKAMKQEAHELGLVFDQEAANKAAEFKDAMTRVKGAMQGAANTIGAELAPLLTELATAFVEVIKQVSDFIRENEIVVKILAFLSGQTVEQVKANMALEKSYNDVSLAMDDTTQSARDLGQEMVAQLSAAQQFTKTAAEIIASKQQARYREFVESQLAAGAPGPAPPPPLSPYWTPEFGGGGTVPGAIGQRVPIIAHGGETIIPAGRAGTVVNINVAGSVISEREVGAIAQRELLRLQRLNVDTGLITS